MEYFKNYFEHRQLILEASAAAKAVGAKYPTTLKKITGASKVPVLSTKQKTTELAEVKFLQSYLNAKGITTGTDGKYGDKTAASVKALQKKLALTADGIAGLKTWIAVLKDMGVDASNYTSYQISVASEEEADEETTDSTDTKGGEEAAGDAPAAPTTTAATTVAKNLQSKHSAVLKRIQDSKTIVSLSIKNAKTVLADAKLVQEYLTALKMGTLTADGMFGAKSEAAAKKFQAAKKLTADGIFGLKSWTILLKDFGIDATGFKSGAATATAAGSTSSGDVLGLPAKYPDFFKYAIENKKVPLLSDKIASTKYSYVEMFQTYLNLKGFNVGAADGLFGKGTKAGVAAMQKAGKLTSDGIVGLKTWAILFKDVNQSFDGMTLTNPVPPKAGGTATTTPTTAPATTASGAGDWYAYSAKEQEAFKAMTFKGGDKPMTGTELLATDMLKTNAITKLITDTYNVGATKLLLKQSKALGANPIQLIMQDGTATANTMKTIIAQTSEKVDAEILYYGMRGTEAEKGHGSSLNTQYVLQARRSQTETYKHGVEQHFAAIAAAAKDAYSDTNAFPLRKWLYEEFKDSDPAKWMNMITKADIQSDQTLYPQLYQKK